MYTYKNVAGYPTPTPQLDQLNEIFAKSLLFENLLIIVVANL